MACTGTIVSAELKSLAHPEWPYAGTAHEWRGFVKDEKQPNPMTVTNTLAVSPAVYQKQNFGPELK